MDLPLSTKVLTLINLVVFYNERPNRWERSSEEPNHASAAAPPTTPIVQFSDAFPWPESWTRESPLGTMLLSALIDDS
jgi:hypothetical protein